MLNIRRTELYNNFILEYPPPSKGVLMIFQDCKLLVMSKLNWNTNAITPHDFVGFILCQVPISKITEECDMAIKKHVDTFVD